MILDTPYRLWQWDKTHSVLLAEILLYNVTLLWQGFSLRLLCLFWGAGWIWSAARSRVPQGARELPGPWGLPIIGRVHDIDLKRSWFKFKEWGDQYGPIYQMTMMGTTHVWISDHRTATELLSRRAHIYSDRPAIPHLPGTKDGVEYLPFLRYGDVWRRQRKFGSSMLKEAHAGGYYGYLIPETHRFLANLLDNSSAYSTAIDSYLGRVTCLLGWGTPEPIESVASNAYIFMHSISPAGPLANALPALMWFPEWLVRSKKVERQRYAEEGTLFTKLLQQAVMENESGNASPSYTQTLLKKKPGFSQREAAYAVGMMANVAILTIGSPLRTFILAMVLHPSWQETLRAEIDDVLAGEDRLIGLHDAPKLPVLRAIIKECFRWRPPIPTGIPHELEKDDVWNGYFIPKGAYVHVNEWSLARDPAMYPDPDRFNPNRFLDPSFPTYREPLSEHPTIRGYHGFGFGRRICPGQEVAEDGLLISCAALAWGFRLERKRDLDGNEVPIDDYDFTSTLITASRTFELDFIVRSEERAQRIAQRAQALDTQPK